VWCGGECCGGEVRAGGGELVWCGGEVRFVGGRMAPNT
jgi:hypothetical protein